MEKAEVKKYEELTPKEKAEADKIAREAGMLMVDYRTTAEMYEDIANWYIGTHGAPSVKELRMQKYAITGEIMNEMEKAIAIHNKDHKEQKWTLPKTLPATCCARLIVESGDVCLITLTTGAPSSEARIAVRDYNDAGEPTGIWILDRETKQNQNGILRALVRNLMSLEAGSGQVDSCRGAIKSELEERCELYPEGWDKDLMVFFNGVWNGKTREFTYFSDPDYEEKYGDKRFLSKMDTDWNPNAKHPDYFNPLTFIRSLMPDGVAGDVQYQQIMHAIQFTLRRYSGQDGTLVELLNDAERSEGKGGKSTLLEFIMGMIDHSSCKAYADRKDRKAIGRTNGAKVLVAPINDWAKDFILAGMVIGLWMLVSDEVRIPPIDPEAVKIFARAQPYLFNQKNLDPFMYVAHMVCWLAMNGSPRWLEKTGSMFTHQKAVMMDKDFNEDHGGKPDKLIKTKYIAEEETWEWMAHYVATEVAWLEDFPKDDTGTMKANIEHTKKENINSFQALDSIMPGLAMCPRIPTEYVYDLYRGWCEQNGVDYEVPQQQFRKDVKQWVTDHEKDYEIVQQDRIKKTKTYDVKKDVGKADRTDAKASEWEILFEYLHPSVIQYGQPTKKHGVGVSIMTRNAPGMRDYVFGNFNERTAMGNVKMSQLIVNKHPIPCYEEMYEDAEERMRTRERLLKLEQHRKEQKNQKEINFPKEAEAETKLSKAANG